jgi:hypothetical protein
MAGIKTRRGAVLGTRKRFIIGTNKEVKRVQLRGGKARFVWMTEEGTIFNHKLTELR